ncbi:DNA-binding FrmR family transcriptional regulator [Bisgaardia hudsonensis]|uniref:DNA-binding FrmR family transcriptional regulator n=1 Tax=Bisgaardia hudsonensis TaxID=109472 RepID=A0A4R2N109_9PAST|nr:formaldehyde-responsive transcriptional repressor FrmR [Bisgaardia hudsonensis]QLB13228.1 regulator protein FrmR [Bisgaardia hudsonensis]TCP13193.1 DNA-binding FrmR family transcriptional regulator [Bisgaardia hudsonensis]
MPSTPEERKKVLTRVHRLKGQINSLEQALENEVECKAILQQIAAIRGATNGLMAQILESHLRETFSTPSLSLDEQLQSTTDDFINIIRTYLK